MRFKAEHIFFKEGIDFCVAINFCAHLFDFHGNRGIKIVL